MFRSVPFDRNRFRHLTEVIGMDVGAAENGLGGAKRCIKLIKAYKRDP